MDGLFTSNPMRKGDPSLQSPPRPIVEISDSDTSEDDAPVVIKNLELSMADTPIGRVISRSSETKGRLTQMQDDVESFSFFHAVQVKGVIIILSMILLAGPQVILIWEYTANFANFRRMGVIIFVMLGVGYLYLGVHSALTAKYNVIKEIKLQVHQNTSKSLRHIGSSRAKRGTATSHKHIIKHFIEDNMMGIVNVEHAMQRHRPSSRKMQLVRQLTPKDAERQAVHRPYNIMRRALVRAITQVGDSSERKKLVLSYKSISRVKKLFSITGPYYMMKVYGFQIASTAISIVNFISIFSCTLDTVVLTIYCVAITLQRIFILWSTFRVNTVALRGLRLKVAIVARILETWLPPYMVYMMYDVKVTLSEMLQIVLIDSILVMIKLKSLLNETLRENVAKQFRNVRRTMNINHAQLAFDMIAEIQGDNVPPSTLFVVRLVLGTFVAFMSAMVVFLAATVANPGFTALCGAQAPERAVWGNCRVKVPLCRNLFSPRCNCAVLKMSDLNMSALPDVVNTMDGLRRAEIMNVGLKELSQEFGKKMDYLSLLSVRNNQLSLIPDAVATLPLLHTLDVAFNNVKELPSALWRRKELYALFAGSNQISGSLGGTEVDLENLHYLEMSNNSISILPNLGHETSPSLSLLSISGNNLTSLPASIGTLKHLRYFYIARNRLTVDSFPDGMGEFRLVYLDVRNNSLAAMPPWVENVVGADWSLTASDNPVCSNGWIDSEECSSNLRKMMNLKETGCARQCSYYCVDKWLVDFPSCEPSCDTKDCGYGNCKV